tara:strand:- start:258 stop:419 length:162 start_codon:yes stop_codon:yes gene_type:complete
LSAIKSPTLISAVKLIQLPFLLYSLNYFSPEIFFLAAATGVLKPVSQKQGRKN